MCIQSWKTLAIRGLKTIKGLSIVLVMAILSTTSAGLEATATPLKQIAIAPTSTIAPSNQLNQLHLSAQGEAVLKLGSDGVNVEEVQTRLKQLGYLKDKIDGHYGKKTQAAVIAFQTNVGLEADGIVGPKTLQQLHSVSPAVTPSAPSPASEQRSTMPPDIQRIVERGKLVVAILGKDNPPFFMPNDSGDLDGFDIQIATAIAEQLGVALEFNRSAQTFDEVVDRVYLLDADLAISKLSRTLNRAKRVVFSSPYIKMRQGLLVNRLQLAQQPAGRNVTETVRHLKGKVGVIQGSSYVGFIKQRFPNATIVEFPAWTDIVDAVIRGDILAAYRDELEIKKIVLAKPDAALKLQTIALTDTQDSIAMALPWDSRHLLSFVNQYLDTMAPNYSVDTLLDEYLSQ